MDAVLAAPFDGLIYVPQLILACELQPIAGIGPAEIRHGQAHEVETEVRNHFEILLGEWRIAVPAFCKLLEQIEPTPPRQFGVRRNGARCSSKRRRQGRAEGQATGGLEKFPAVHDLQLPTRQIGERVIWFWRCFVRTERNEQHRDLNIRCGLQMNAQFADPVIGMLFLDCG